MAANKLEVTLSFKPLMDGLNRFTSAIQQRMEAVRAFNQRIENGAKAVNSLLAQGAAFFAVGKLESYIGKAEEAARAQAQLTAALQRTGQFSPEYVAALNAQAKALKLVTDYSGNQIAAVQRQLVAARLSREQVLQMTEAVLDLAAQLNADPDAVAKLVGKFFRGDAEELSRLGLKIDETKDRYTGLLEAMRRFAGGQARAAVVFPDLHHAAVEIGALKKEVGALVANAIGPFLGGFAHGLHEVHDWLKEVLGRMKEFTPSAESLRPVGEVLGKIAVAAFAVIAPLLLIRAIVTSLPVLINPVRMGFVALAGVDFIDAIRDLQLFSKELGIMQAMNLANWGQRFAAFGAVAAAAFAGVELGLFLNKLEVGGMTIGDWVARTINWFIGWGDRIGAAFQTAWVLFKFDFLDRLAQARITILEFVNFVAEKLNVILPKKWQIPTDSVKAAIAEYKKELGTLDDEKTAALAAIETRLQGNLKFRADVDADLAAKGRAGVAKPSTIPTPMGTGDTGDLDRQELERKRKLFRLETDLIRAKAEHNQKKIDAIQLDIDELKLQDEIRALQLGPEAKAALDARREAMAAALKDERGLQQSLFEIENQRQAAELAGNQPEMDRLARLAKEKQLQIELQALGAAAGPLIKARLDAEDALLKKQRERTEAERKMSEQLGAIGIKRADIESDVYKTTEEKQRAILPLLREEAKIIQDRISLLEQELLLGADEKRKGEIMGSLDQLRASQAQNRRDQAVATPQTFGQGIEQGVSGQGGFLESLGTAAQNAASAVSGTLNGALTATQGLLYNLASGAMNFRQAWGTAILAVGQQFLQSTTEMVAKMLWRATIERALVALGVTTHVAGEQTKTAATLGGMAIRIGATIKEALASVYHGAIEAFKALASIPYVGPFLGAAAMAAAVAGGLALVSKIGGHAEGGLITGPGTGTSDSIVRRLSDGEFVNRDASVRKFGVPFFESLNAGILDLAALPANISRGIATPPAAASAVGSAAAPGASAAAAMPAVNVAYFNSEADAMRWLESKQGRKILYRRLGQDRSELGVET
ncbi:MAG: hypothetical protein HZA93_13300 [Verrucomicrobia bacterium]|nr:hypothetical protein [Verrucomicrobiota bacterium]